MTIIMQQVFGADFQRRKKFKFLAQRGGELLVQSDVRGMSDQLVNPVLLSNQFQELILAAGLACVAILPTSRIAVSRASGRKAGNFEKLTPEKRSALQAALDEVPDVE